MITKEELNNSISFEEFYQLTEVLTKEGKSTGEEQSESRIEFTKLNFSRMKRLVKTITISEEIKTKINCLDHQLTWVVLAESWCGDAAQNLPIIYKIAELTPNINLRILLRDENLNVMNKYLTNGGQAIPKLICLDENLNDLGTWGPRPQFLQDWMKKEKADPTMEMADLKKEFQVWYTKDKGETLQAEMIDLIKVWLKKESLCEKQMN